VLVTLIEETGSEVVTAQNLRKRCGDLLARKKSAAMTETVRAFVPSRSRFFTDVPVFSLQNGGILQISAENTPRGAGLRGQKAGG